MNNNGFGNKEVFAKNLKYYMKLNNKKRKQICNDLSFPYSTFTDWANGKIYPRMDKVEMLANYFGILKSDLIEDKTTKHSDIFFEPINGGYKVIASEEIEKMQERWFNEIGSTVFTDEEMTKLISYAQFLLSQRGDSNE